MPCHLQPALTGLLHPSQRSSLVTTNRQSLPLETFVETEQERSDRHERERKEENARYELERKKEAAEATVRRKEEHERHERERKEQ